MTGFPQPSQGTGVNLTGSVNPDGVTDNVAVLNQAAASLASGPGGTQGGIIDLPRGNVAFGPGLNVDNTRDIVFRGAGGISPTQSATRLTYLGSGAGTALSARSCQGFGLDRLALEYIDPAFTGWLLDASGGSTNGDVNGLFLRAVLRGRGAGVHGGKLLNLDQVVAALAPYLVVSNYTQGIVGPSAGSYSYNVNVGFIHSIGGAESLAPPIWNAGRAWHFQQAVFEPIVGGIPGAYGHDASQTLTAGLRFDSIYAADDTAAGSWFQFAGNGLTIGGGLVGLSTATSILVKIDGTNTQGVRLTSPLWVTGNVAASLIDVSAAVTPGPVEIDRVSGTSFTQLGNMNNFPANSRISVPGGNDGMRGLQIGGGSPRITGGTGVPATPGGQNPLLGDLFFRADGGVGTTIYRCTNAVGPVWTAIL